MSARDEGSLHDDLLTPSLDARHDVAGIDRPFDPSSLGYVAFFCGPLFGGAIVAWNWVRLGVPGAFAKTLALFIALWLACGVGYFYVALLEPATRAIDSAADATPPAAVGGKYETSERRERGRTVSFVAQILSVVPALLVARRQKQRYRLHEVEEGSRPAPVLRIGLAAFALNLLVTPFAYACLAVGLDSLHRP